MAYKQTAVLLLILGSSVATAAVERMTRDTFEGEVRRFAQRYASTMNDLSAEIRARPLTGEQTHRITVFQVESVASAVSIAIGENPVTNLLDMMALASLTRIRFDEGFELKNDPIATLLVETSQALEADAWALSAFVLTREQQDTVRRLVKEWAAANPDELFVWPSRFSSYSGMQGTGLDKVQRTGGLLRQFTRGIDVVHQTRELGERMIFYIQYAPYIVAMQTDQIVRGLLTSPEIDESLAGINGLLPTIEAASALAKEINETTKTLERTAGAINLDLGGQSGDPVDVDAYTSLLEKSTVAMTEMRQLIDALERLAESQPANQGFPKALDGLRDTIDGFVIRIFMLVVATIIVFFITFYFYQRASHRYRTSREQRP